MITAQDVLKYVKDTDAIIDHSVDPFIELCLRPAFVVSKGKPIKLYESTIPEKFTSLFLKTQLQLRGFTVDYACEDRPCGRCWLLIGLGEDK